MALWSWHVGITYFGALAFAFSTFLEQPRFIQNTHTKAAQGRLGIPPDDGVLRGFNGVNVMSSLPVCVTQILGLWLWNFRCMPMQIVHVLLCAPRCFGF